MDQWKAIIATLMIFGSGVGTGHLLTRQAAPETTRPATKRHLWISTTIQ